MLDLKKLLDMQKELDKTILDNAGIKEYPLENIKLALLVELGELANEWKGFKHWKKHKDINRDKLLEEFADCLSFALSLENELHQAKKYGYEDLITIIEDVKKILVGYDLNAKEAMRMSAFELAFSQVSNLKNVISNTLSVGIYLDLTFEEMEQAYLAKNKVNYERQNNGY
ncbi:MAG: dUTP diphosphatase [Clostridium sp.]|uniref:dUTP diphosphatase n=1 Tax=Clostridium sp. TaxID=1506 RepID=UPI0039E88D3F